MNKLKDDNIYQQFSWRSHFISFGLAITGILAFAFIPRIVNPQSNSPQPSQPFTTSPEEIIPQSSSPRRLNITVKVSDPSDLKIQEGDTIEKGQLVADRTRQRKRLESQKNQLNLSINRLKATPISPPLPPLKAEPISALPPISYMKHEAAIEKAKAVVSSFESQIDLKEQEIAYLTELPKLDPIILEHENNKLEQLKQQHNQAVRDYQLAMGELQAAREARAYQEYQAQIVAARRVEEINQANLLYQRQLGEYEQRLADKDYRLTQLKLNLNNVENALASLGEVKSPYSGTIRRIKWLGQSPDGTLTAEIMVMVNSSPQPTDVNSKFTQQNSKYHQD